MFWSSCRYVMEMTFITLHVPANLSNNLDEFGSLLQWNGTKFLRLKFVSQDAEFSEFKQCFEESRVPDRFTATVCAIAMTVATQERTADGSQPAGVVHRSPLGKCRSGVDIT